jgi:preprotein translocase subunit YajC
MSFWTVVAVLAQNDPAPAPGPGGPGGLSSMLTYLVPIALIFLVFQFLIARPQRREQAKRDELIKSLKKNDPVTTIGGIIGTVVSISEDGSEVTVKVDDNTRIKFRRDAIRDVIRKGDPPKEGEAK